MSKANAINKRLVNDYLSLQNWLLSRQQAAVLFIDYNCSSHNMAEISGYHNAITETIAFVSSLKSQWPTIKVHKNYLG